MVDSPVSTISLDDTEKPIEKATPSLGISMNQEVESEAIDKPAETINESVEAPKQVAAYINISEKSPGVKKNKHSLSIDGLKSQTRKDEEAQILENLQAVNTQIAENSKDEDEPVKIEEKKELFGNYESKFTNQSSEILKRLRMPKTRIWMLFSLSLICIVVIGALMYIDPKTHSISNYKTSVKSIYNDIKKWDKNESELPIGETNIPEEDVNRKNPLEDQTSEEIIVVEQTPEEKANKKEEIKKENLKNFLIENFK